MTGVSREAMAGMGRRGHVSAARQVRTMRADERWAEIGWRLRFRVAYGHLCWRNCVESANLFETLLPELDEDRFKLWPYTDEARYFWQTKVCQWWGYDALHLGQYEEARRLAEQSLALGEQSGIPLLRLDGLISLASVLISTGDCRQAEMHLREYSADLPRSRAEISGGRGLLSPGAGIGRSGRLCPGACLSSAQPGLGQRERSAPGWVLADPGQRGVGARQPDTSPDDTTGKRFR